MLLVNGCPLIVYSSTKSRQDIWLGSHSQLSNIDFESLRNSFSNVHFSSSVHDLGFFLDPVLSLSDHVNSVTRSCFCYLRQLLLSRQSLPLHAITILVHTLICTRVDYGNAVYIGLSSTTVMHLSFNLFSLQLPIS